MSRKHGRNASVQINKRKARPGLICCAGDRRNREPICGGDQKYRGGARGFCCAHCQAGRGDRASVTSGGTLFRRMSTAWMATGAEAQPRWHRTHSGQSQAPTPPGVPGAPGNGVDCSPCEVQICCHGGEDGDAAMTTRKAVGASTSHAMDAMASHLANGCVMHLNMRNCKTGRSREELSETKKRPLKWAFFVSADRCWLVARARFELATFGL